jgi:hypothetical protein
MGKRRGLYRVLVGKTEEIAHLEDGRVILRWTGLIWLKTGTGGEHL